MANTASAKKRIRQNAKRRARNRIFRGSARTYIKSAHTLIDSGKFDEAEAMVRKASSILDKSARKGILHPNNASRRKGRLMAHLDAARKANA